MIATVLIVERSHVDLRSQIAITENLKIKEMGNFPQTERLLIREWQFPDDAPSAFAIYGDAEVMHYLRPPVITMEAAQELLEQEIAHEQALNNGTGLWAVVTRNHQQVIGTILLSNLPDVQGNLTPKYEIGWHFCRASWGQGYATEAAKLIIDYGFNHLGIDTLYAVSKPENIRSLNLIKKLAMKPLGLTKEYYGGIPLLLFQSNL